MAKDVQAFLAIFFRNYILDDTNQGSCIFFIWACRRGITSHSHTQSNAAAPSGFPLQCLAATAQVLDSFTLFANFLRCATDSPPAISVSIPHAGSSNPSSVSRRAAHNLVSIFSRAATFPRSIPSSDISRTSTFGYQAFVPNGTIWYFTYACCHCQLSINL